MRIKFASLGLCIMMLLAACSSGSDYSSSPISFTDSFPEASNASPSAETTYFSPTEEQTIFPGMEVLEFDYRMVISPVIYGNTLYMAVSEERKPREDYDARLLISYDIDTKETQYLYESVYESANLQQISCDGKWLVWTDQEAWGAACDICVMNLETREIKKVDSFKPEAASFLIPKLQKERVYWLKEESYNESENRIYGSVYEYDCLAEKTKKLYSLDYIEFYNLAVGVGSGKVIWSETIEDVGTLFIYDISSGKIDKYETSFKYACSPLYSNGFAKFQGQNDFSQRYEFPNRNYWYDTKTGKTSEIAALDDYMFAMSDNYVAASCGTIIYYYKKNGAELTLLEPYTAVRGDCKFSENDIFINAVEQDKKFVIYINKLKDFPIQGAENG